MIDDFKPVPNRNQLNGAPRTAVPVKVSAIEVATPPETIKDKPRIIPPPNLGTQKPPKKPKKTVKIGRFKFSIPDLTKKQWALVIVGMLLLFSAIGFGLYRLFYNEPPPPPPPPPVVQKEEPPKPTTEPSPLTGIMVDPEVAKIPVTAVMIENSPDARPQAGLRGAGLVFEAIAEGGITRFLALYQESKPDPIGPIRSVRPYYLDWAVAFDAPIAHVGGSAPALEQIRNQRLKDLDQFASPGHFYRVSSRYAPHNMYSSRKLLLDLHEAKGYKTSEFEPWPRQDEEALKTPKATVIDFAISGFLYNPRFTYDAKTNTYLRSMNGRPHVDEKSGKQIDPKVVIGMVIPKGIHPNGVHSTYQTHGRGKAVIFQNGDVINATWQKKDRSSMIKFVDDKGEVIELNRGNTWISVVGLAGSITHTP